MFGVIMAGGQGTRLYPLTKNRPKPMVEVLGRPVIEFVKDAMVNSGVTNIIVTTGYKGEMLEQLVESWSSNDSRLSSSKINQELQTLQRNALIFIKPTWKGKRKKRLSLKATIRVLKVI